MATPKKRARQVVRETRKELEVETAPPPAYFLSLTVENIRSFGPAQTLDLSDGKGHPARWTVILGDNGVGKTTLLQVLARSEGRRLQLPTGIRQPLRDVWMLSAGDRLSFTSIARVAREHDDIILANLTVSVISGAALTGPSDQEVINRLEVAEMLNQYGGPYQKTLTASYVTECLSALVCYGYGATRRMGGTSLSEAREKDTAATLFSDEVELLNPDPARAGW